MKTYVQDKWRQHLLKEAVAVGIIVISGIMAFIHPTYIDRVLILYGVILGYVFKNKG